MANDENFGNDVLKVGLKFIQNENI